MKKIMLTLFSALTLTSVLAHADVIITNNTDSNVGIEVVYYHMCTGMHRDGVIKKKSTKRIPINLIKSVCKHQPTECEGYIYLSEDCSTRPIGMIMVNTVDDTVLAENFNVDDHWVRVDGDTVTIN